MELAGTARIYRAVFRLVSLFAEFMETSGMHLLIG